MANVDPLVGNPAIGLAPTPVGHSASSSAVVPSSATHS